jgi:hypothetical protein
MLQIESDPELRSRDGGRIPFTLKVHGRDRDHRLVLLKY